jgi:hypothetical protein
MTAGRNPQLCSASRRDGMPCTGKPLASGFCFAHDPHAGEWRRKGGQQRANGERAVKRLPSRLRPLVEGLETAFAQVLAGKLDAAQARALASLASSLLEVYAAVDLERHTAASTALRDEIDAQLASLVIPGRGA